VWPAKLAVNDLDFFIATLYIGLFCPVAFLVVLAVRQKIGRILPEFARQPFFYIGAGIIAFGLQQIVYMKAYAVQPASDTVVTYYLYPLLMVILASMLFGETTSWRRRSWCWWIRRVWVLVSDGHLLQIRLSWGRSMPSSRRCPGRCSQPGPSIEDSTWRSACSFSASSASCSWPR